MDGFVGPYRILRLLNRGGQGSVYLGYDKRLHRRVAIKIYQLPPTRKARKQLLREARAVASIQSPKVVQIHDVIQSDTHLALVMEYVSGCSLEEFLAQVRPSLASVLVIGTDIAGALALARQQHIVHGDVKPGNVLIGTNGRAKLADFGISRTTTERSALQWRSGSTSALSPEQLLGQPVDERADLFALGCLLYLMMSGQHPFYNKGKFDPQLLLACAPQPIQEVVGGEVELPDQLADLIAALLQKEPSRRPANTRRVRRVLRAVMRSLPVSTANNLQREALPCFRPESPEDIPPLIPEGLGQQGRSALEYSGSWTAMLRQRVNALRWQSRAALAFAVLAVSAVLLTRTLYATVTPVRFAQPYFTSSTRLQVPQEISRTWLVNEVKSVLRNHLGNVRVAGPVGADPRTVFYSGGEPSNWNESSEQVFHIALRCVEELCVFSISRDHKGASFTRQGVLFPDMSLQQWREIVRESTLALYK
ncbi:MAG: serine/threonine-protein kinase [Halioglobus sp.]